MTYGKVRLWLEAFLQSSNPSIENRPSDQHVEIGREDPPKSQQEYRTVCSVSRRRRRRERACADGSFFFFPDGYDGRR